MTASPLPAQLVPLLEENLEKLKDVVKKVLPEIKKRSTLEEAEWEYEGSGDGDEGFEREIMLQGGSSTVSFVCGLFDMLMVSNEIMFSDGNSARVPSPGRITRPNGNGPELRRSCNFASFRGVSCANSRFG